MANFFAPQVEYKAPTFQELAAPLAVYQAAYNDMEEKYDAQKEKAAMLQAMLGTDPDNEISNYMADYNTLMDQTARAFSSGNLPYAQLYSNYKQLQNIWNDKGLKMTAGIESYTKYKEAKKAGLIGPEYTLMDFVKNPQLKYNFFDPNELFKLGSLDGAAYAQQKGPYGGRKAPNGKWIDEYGPSVDEIKYAFSDKNNPFYNSARNALQLFGIKDDDPYLSVAMNAYQSGLNQNRKQVLSSDVNYLTTYQRYQIGRQNKADAKAERLENMYKDAWKNRPPQTNAISISDKYKNYTPAGSNESFPVYSWNWGTPTEEHYSYGYFTGEGDDKEWHPIDEKALVSKGKGTGSNTGLFSGLNFGDTSTVGGELYDVPTFDTTKTE